VAINIKILANDTIVGDIDRKIAAEGPEFAPTKPNLNSQKNQVRLNWEHLTKKVEDGAKSGPSAAD